MLYPITPIFLTAVLGASMTSVGFIEGFAEAVASLLKTFSGVWSDRILKRKPFVIVGYALGAMAKPLMGLSSTWFGILCARGIDRTGKGLRTAPRDALLAESVAPEARGGAFGWHRGMDTLGAAIGPLFAIVYLSYFKDNLRPIYYLALIPGLVSVAIAFFIREKTHDTKTHATTNLQFSDLKWITFSKPFKIYVVAWTVFSLTNSSDVFLLMRAKEQGLELQSIILLYCLYNLTYSLLSPWLGGLSDRIGRKPLLILGLVLFSGVYLGFSMATQTGQFIALFTCYGIYMAATDGVGKALLIDLVSPHQKATALGIFGTVSGFATIIASTVAGYFWDHFGSTTTFLYGISGALLAAIIIFWVPKASNSSD